LIDELFVRACDGKGQAKESDKRKVSSPTYLLLLGTRNWRFSETEKE